MVLNPPLEIWIPDHRILEHRVTPTEYRYEIDPTLRALLDSFSSCKVNEVWNAEHQYMMFCVVFTDQEEACMFKLSI